MSNSTTLLASGTGWRVSDVVCTSGPQDRSFEEQHGTICIALVTEGIFQYRGVQGSALMSPGSVLLGNLGTCFECGHEHSTGDRCLAFHLLPEFVEPIVAAVPGACHMYFATPRLPPLPLLLPIIVAAQAMRDRRAALEAFRELALRLVGAVCAVLNDSPRTARVPSHRDERRIASALCRIEAEESGAVPVDDLARDAAMSSYHFLRIFEQTVGVTPGQYMLRTRLRRAAARLVQSRESIATIALGCGFNDLSTFNRHFRRMSGLTPSMYRGQRHRSRLSPV